MIHDKFLIQRTSSFEETVLFLIAMTRWIKGSLHQKSIKIKPEPSAFPELSGNPGGLPVSVHSGNVVEGVSLFQIFSKKHGRRSGLTLGDIYCSQLCCIHSISPEKAKAIARKYPTLQRCVCEAEAEFLLANVSLPNGRRLGEKSSSLVYSSVYRS
ncbi:hypothetical protein DI09_80p30 [Mitosporidium daphniae]|uniref:Uncharacterized protein n=1 Tax=Mitosporidium daphniae TaxID=1485682 RepID=A0A098VMI7_9MICR|nr:uncharacterized protein DI09_82p40 [Mitosporidium daphniae]XP_013236651.1 uncharacterized protein DI09_80p30 [Mitosporidium daphniae]KGG50185.1 hypothetical protein DI09_82p40 [Mitosporidium daphniae]KGG50209.1 hypothetical protein DI09_80p30 [Mitosporidium daphniae]|eukprot:XP_013236628.1 uncharacterized protein DI09_82p40 [Mitosporidium daphniae]